MAEALYSVEQVAELLGLHVRTVRNYVRDGRLKAVRIGKQYRISRAKLEELTGSGVGATVRESTRRVRAVEVSTVVQIDAIGRADADRLSILLTSASMSRDPDGPNLRLQTIYDEERASMKIVIFGGTADTAELLRLVDVLTEEES
jgi:excisionase family DNA binding protein